MYSLHSMPVSVIFSRSRGKTNRSFSKRDARLQGKHSFHQDIRTRVIIYPRKKKKKEKKARPSRCACITLPRKVLASLVWLYQIRIPLSRTLTILFATPSCSYLSFFFILCLAIRFSIPILYPKLLHSSGLAYCLVHLSLTIHSHGFLSLSLFSPEMNLRAVLVFLSCSLRGFQATAFLCR